LTLRAIWDCGLFLGGAVPPFIFGVIIGNLMQGIPLALDGDINPYYSENIWHLLNPYALLAGFVSSAMIAMQGGVYLANQTNSVIQDRAIRVAIVAALFMMIVFIGAEIWFQHIQESRTASAIGASSISTPITTLTAIAYDGWTANCVQHSLVWILPAFSIMAGALVSVLHRFRQSLIGFFASSIAIAGVVGTMGAAVLPLLLSCSKVHNTRLDIWNSVSSHFNLPAMSWSTIVLIPFIVIYILWVLRVVREKDSKAFIHANNYRG
jgi:cytochrome d ubiquinol oxidase subunit II